MDAAVLIAIIVTILILVGLMFWGSRRRSAVRLGQARYEASTTRDLAQVAQVEADRQAAAADEAVARAERERLAAEQQRLVADQKRQDAADLHRRADEIDPDVDADRDADVEVDLDAEADTDAGVRRGEPVDDAEAIDLRDDVGHDAASAPIEEPHTAPRER